MNPDGIVRFIQTIRPDWNGDRIIALVRTLVPVAVGALLAQLVVALPSVAAWLDSFYSGWQFGLVGLVQAVVTSGYYALAKVIERKWPVTGKWLLGSGAVPVYVAPVETPVEDAAVDGPPRHARED